MRMTLSNMLRLSVYITVALLASVSASDYGGGSGKGSSAPDNVSSKLMIHVSAETFATGCFAAWLNHAWTFRLFLLRACGSVGLKARCDNLLEPIYEVNSHGRKLKVGQELLWCATYWAFRAPKFQRRTASGIDGRKRNKDAKLPFLLERKIICFSVVGRIVFVLKQGTYISTNKHFLLRFFRLFYFINNIPTDPTLALSRRRLRPP